MKPIARIPAVTKAIAVPSNGFGTLAKSSFSRILEKRISARENPYSFTVQVERSKRAMARTRAARSPPGLLAHGRI